MLWEAGGHLLARCRRLRWPRVARLPPKAASRASLRPAGDRTNGQPNCGYDDSRGDYQTVVRHLRGWAGGSRSGAGCSLGESCAAGQQAALQDAKSHLISPSCTLPPYARQVGDHVAYRYEVTGVLGRGSFGQVSALSQRAAGCCRCRGLSWCAAGCCHCRGLSAAGALQAWPGGLRGEPRRAAPPTLAVCRGPAERHPTPIHPPAQPVGGHPQVLRAVDHASGAEVALKIIVRPPGAGRCCCGVAALRCRRLRLLLRLPPPRCRPRAAAGAPTAPPAARPAPPCPRPCFRRPQRNKKRFQKQAAVEAAILALLREQVGERAGRDGGASGRRGQLAAWDRDAAPRCLGPLLLPLLLKLICPPVRPCPPHRCPR